MKGQKEAVVELVRRHLPNLKPGDCALNMLTGEELEAIKREIADKIVSGEISYGKDRGDLAQVRSYARSMVMNHLKKASELNGGSYVSKQPKPVETKTPDLTILPSELREFVEKLV